MRKLIIWGTLVAIGVSGGIAAQDQTERDDDQQIVEAGDLRASSIRIGDCIRVPADDEFDEVEGVPCQEPHDAQAYAIFEIEGFGDDYPGYEALGPQIVSTCEAAFEPFVGVTLERSELTWSAIEPSVAGWDRAGDRTVTCVVIPIAGTLDFDARDSRR